MKLNRLTGACLTAGLLLYSASAQADRRTSLAGNDLIQDADDAFLFPQDVHLYKNRLTVDLGMAEGLGGGFFTMGDDNMTFGVAIHRGPQEQMIVGWGNRNRERDGQSGFGLALPDEAGIGGAPIERFDGFFGMKLSEQLSLGLRLGIGQGLIWARNEVPDGDNVDTLDDSNSQNAFNIRLGATYRSGSLHLDNAAHIVLASGTTVDDNTTNFQGSDQNFGLSSRAYFNLGKGLDLGAFLGLNIGSGWKIDNTPEDPITGVWNRSNVTLGVGPRVKIDDGPLVAAYAVLNVGSLFVDPDNHPDATNDTTTTSEMILPGIRMSAEYNVRPWVTTRVGMDYSFKSTTVYGFNGDNAANTMNYEPDFGWNAGLGFNFDKLQIDATLNQGSLYFLWQDAPFAMVSATYSFGQAKRSGSSRRSSRIERAPAPEPVDDEPARRSRSSDDDSDEEPARRSRSRDTDSDDDF
ncbi:MAG: hypothetical protein VYB65_12825 [Myxococcota bacterium]|nr:hypothetical protein [Myxococcota bacterium]